MTDALKTQVGGDHYKDLKIQPVEYIHANGLGYFEGNVVKYITRWREKDGVKDLEKIKHYVDLLIELEGLKKSAAQKQRDWEAHFVGNRAVDVSTMKFGEGESKPIEKPWIENFGTCPVLPGTEVEILLRDKISNRGMSEDFRWTIDGDGGDIMQWRHAK